MDPTPSRSWPLWVLAGLAVLLVLYAVVASLRRPARMRARMAADAEDPFRRWAQCVFCLVSGDCDYAYLPVRESVRMLARWWEVHGPVELRRVLDELERGDDAWGGVRFFVVARLGVGATWLAEADAWRRARPVARRLQARYEGWAELARDYVKARRRALGISEDGSEDDDDMRAILDNLVRLSDTLWAEVPFRTAWPEDA
jgi:hypothetical protein